MTAIIMRGLLVLSILSCVSGLTPSTPGPLTLEPSYSYINFDVSLENSTATLAFANHSMFIMARKCKDQSTGKQAIDAGSSEYVWLQRNLSDPLRTTYQVLLSL